jgi:hypothetical protein
MLPTTSSTRIEPSGIDFTGILRRGEHLLSIIHQFSGNHF